MLETLIKLTEYFGIKIGASIVFLVFTVFFGSHYTEALIATFFLFALDFLTGLLASVVYEGNPIRSSSAKPGEKGTIDTIRKGAVFFAAISAAYFADLTIPGAFLQLAMISFVGVNEFISILENIGRMGYRTPQKLLLQLQDKRNNL